MTTRGLTIETRNGRGRISGKEVPLSSLTNLLSSEVGRPVIDKTGIPGAYDFVLYFTTEAGATAESSEPSIFDALQKQLGLKLEAGKGNIDMLIIDHAEKIPTGN